MGMGSDTGEPFLVVVGNDEGIKIGTADTSASHTISISGYIESVVKINPKYLPTEVNELIMNSSTPDSTKKFKITVDDSGALTATEAT